MKYLISTTICFLIFINSNAQNISNSIRLSDIETAKDSPALFVGLQIPSESSILQGFMYKSNNSQKHPTLIMLHGYPGNERNLDLAQIVRAKGWNVIYFNYRGSWGNQGDFSFENCVNDVINVVDFCYKNSDKLQIDSSNIALFGHSMGGWVGLKALQQLPNVKKGFMLSTWDIYGDFKDVKPEQNLDDLIKEWGLQTLVLNTPAKKLLKDAIENIDFYNLSNDGKLLADKNIVMLDEDKRNKGIALSIENENKSFFKYNVWNTDHSFTNKRISLANLVLNFLNE